MPVAELVAVLKQAQREAEAELAATESEIEAMATIVDLVAPVMQGHPDMCRGEALAIRAREGDEQAAALVDQFNSPEARLRELLLEKAVEVDPFWTRDEDGDYRVRAGATHTTPEELVAAYVLNRGDRIADDVPPDLLEYFGQREIERQVGEELERRVAAGELVEGVGEDGKPVYRPVDDR